MGDPVAIKLPRVSALVHGAVRTIRQAGYEPEVDEIIWLYRLSEDQVLPNAHRSPTFFRQPIQVNRRTWLWPPTVEAIMWLDEYVHHWPKNINGMLATAYALAHSDPERAFRFSKMTHRLWAIPRIRSWAWGALRDTEWERVTWACSQLTGNEDRLKVDGGTLIKSTDPAANPLDWGELLSRLSASYKLHPSHFLKMSVDEAYACLRNTPVHGEGAGATRDLSNDPEIERAWMHYQLAIQHIIRRHQVAKGDGSDHPPSLEQESAQQVVEESDR